MNDIEILEKLQNIFKELRKDDEEGHSSAYELQWEDIEAIKNLIQRNKDLEQIEKEHKEENGRLREELDKKDKIINLMAEHIENGCDFDNKIQTKQQILEYFTNKVEEDK